MSISEGNRKDAVERKKRIEELKGQLDELAGGKMGEWKSDELTPEIEEDFLRSVLEYETAPWTTHYRQLEEAGIELPAPETLDDENLKAKLWEVIDALAGIRVFLKNTNHLGDRELYAELWSEVLREETKAMTFDQYSTWHIDLIGSGSEEDIHLWMRYYADEASRSSWMKDWPDYEMPEREEPPYDRDRYLPGAGG